MTHYDTLIAALFPDGAPQDFRPLALVLPGATVAAMAAAQDAIGAARIRIEPVATTDGRWLVGADILPELAPGGLFAAALDHFDQAALAGVEVLPWDDARALIRRPVAINEDDAETLAARLPGVGPTLAAQIEAGRPWADVADLAGLSGVSAGMVAAWQDDPGLVL